MIHLAWRGCEFHSSDFQKSIPRRDPAAVHQAGRIMTKSVYPFHIAVPDSVLTDLQARLRVTRWPEAELVDDWSQGAPLAWIQDVCRYWADEYNWRAREALLNRFNQFTTTIDGLDIHFVHQRSPHPGARQASARR